MYDSAKYLWSKKTRGGNGLRRRRLHPHLTLCLVLLSPSFLSSSVSPSVSPPLLSLLILSLLVLLLWWRREHSSFIRRQDDDKGKDSSGYGSRDSLVSSGREREDGSAYRRTRSDLSAELISRANADAKAEDRKSSWSSKWVLVFLDAYRRPIL